MAEFEAGRIVGNYRVVRCIGQGGMGTVYEVEHELMEKSPKVVIYGKER